MIPGSVGQSQTAPQGMAPKGPRSPPAPTISQVSDLREGGWDHQGEEAALAAAPLWSHPTEPCRTLGPAKLSPRSGPANFPAWEHVHGTQGLHSSVCGLREGRGQLGAISAALRVFVNDSFPVARSDSPLLPS